MKLKYIIYPLFVFAVLLIIMGCFRQKEDNPSVSPTGDVTNISTTCGAVTSSPVVTPTNEEITTPTASPVSTECPTSTLVQYTSNIPDNCTPTITLAPTSTPTANVGEWFNVVLTVYNNSHNPTTPHGCKGDIPLEEGWSCASFCPEFFTRETELSMEGITELPYGTIIEIDAKDMGGYTGYYIICDTTTSTKIWNERWHDIKVKYAAKTPKSWIDMYDTSLENQNVKGLARIRVIYWGDGETYLTREQAVNLGIIPK